MCVDILFVQSLFESEWTLIYYAAPIPECSQTILFISILSEKERKKYCYILFTLLPDFRLYSLLDSIAGSTISPATSCSTSPCSSCEVNVTDFEFEDLELSGITKPEVGMTRE